MATQSIHAGEPLPLIFDTDIGNDVDDVLALAVIHALQDRGECELLAVTVTKDTPAAAPFVDAINTFYGRGEVPIGVCNSGLTPHGGGFLDLVKEGAYPHDAAPSGSGSAVSVLRRALSAADEKSVAIAQVGFSTNLANLLKSEPDDISPLSGVELVRQKVKLLSIMAGDFRRAFGKKVEGRRYAEYNVAKHVEAARTIAEEWPTKVVWSGAEIGSAVTYPYESILKDYGYVDRHPVRESYEIFNNVLNKPGHCRPCWDLTSVLYAVRPDRDYFGLSKAGDVVIIDEGHTDFTASEQGLHRFLTIDEMQIARLVPTLVALSSQPPQAK